MICWRSLLDESKPIKIRSNFNPYNTMSLLDIEGTEKRTDEYLMQLQKDKESWAKLQAEVIMPRVKKLKQRKPIRNFAAGVYMPEDFTYELGQLLDSLCNVEGIGLFSLDCSQAYVERSRFDFFRHIIDRPFTVILLENFDQIPNLPEKKYIENLLIHSWESDDYSLTHRNNFFVLFSTSKDYGEQTPDLLKKIKSLDWYGSIYK